MSAETEEAENTASFQFDIEFQRKIAALAMRDSLFMQKVDGLIKPEYFVDGIDAAIVSVVINHFQKYKSVPAFNTIGPVFNGAIRDKLIRKDIIPDLKDRLRELVNTDLSDAQYAVDEVVKFAQHRALENAILKSVALLDKGDYTSILKEIKVASDVGVNDTDGEYDYWGEIDNRTQERLDLVAGIIKPRSISTGIPDLDKLLYHGGWGYKELTVIMGAAKAGKSMSLGEFAKIGSMLGHNVLYVTLEVAARIIADRTDANLSDTAMRVLKDHPHDISTKIKAAATKAGRLTLIERPSGSFKASALRRLIEHYRGQGVMFDMIVVDYADIMAPERYSNDLKEDMRQIYLDLRAIAQEYDVVMLTATQTNREGAKSMTAKMTDVAEDFNKIRTADLVISINASEEEKKSGEARLFLAASRNQQETHIRIKQDREKMKFFTGYLGLA